MLGSKGGAKRKFLELFEVGLRKIWQRLGFPSLLNHQVATAGCQWVYVETVERSGQFLVTPPPAVTLVTPVTPSQALQLLEVTRGGGLDVVVVLE